MHYKGSAPALANPTKSKNKIQESFAKYYQKKEIRERPIRVNSVASVFLFFLICVPAEGRGHNANTEQIYQ